MLIFTKILLLFSLSFLVTCKATKEDIPNLISPVMDPGNLLPTDSRRELEEILLKFQRETSHQIVVYITPKIKFDTIEEEAVQTFEAWKLGLKEKDNGVLYLLAPNDRKVRIEVGYGLESVLTDIAAKRIIDQIIIPNMKANQLVSAVKQGTLAILDQIKADTPSILSKSCPHSFSDVKDWLHPDTIPLLQKDIKNRKAIRNYEIMYCISDVQNEFALEAQAYGLLKNRTHQDKPGFVFLAASDGNSNFFGKIVVDASLSWLFSENKKREIFNEQYKYMSEGDMTNYSYQSMIRMLDDLEKWESPLPELKKETGLQDPYSVLVTFSRNRVIKTIEEVETDLKVPFSVLLLKTNSDLKTEAKKFFHQVFKDENGVLLLLSINEKNFTVVVGEKTEFPNKKQNSTIINAEYLIDNVKFATRTSLKEGDIDWITSYAADSLYTDIKNYYGYQEDGVSSKRKTTTAQKEHQVPGLWQGVKALLAILALLMFVSAEGIPFFTIVFYFIANAFRDHLTFLSSDFSYAIEGLLLFACALVSFLFVLLCRKLKLTEPTISFVESSSNYIGELRGGGGSSGSSSSRSSSSSSYSGGGGRSGGGGASGGW